MNWRQKPISWAQMIKINGLLKYQFIPDTLKFNNALKKVVGTQGNASKFIDRLLKREKKLTMTEEEIEQIIRKVYEEVMNS